MCLDCLRSANKVIKRCDAMLAEIKAKKAATRNLITKSFLSAQERDILNHKKEAESERLNWLMVMN